MFRRLFAFLLFAFFLFVACPATLPAQNSAAHKAQLERDELVMKDHLLTVDEITRCMQVTSEAKQAGEDDPQLKHTLSKDDNDDDQQTLDQMTAKFGSVPKLVAIMSAHGFTPRQYAVAIMTIVQVSLATFALESGVKRTDPAFANVNPANLRLMQEHKADIEALRQKYPQ